MNSSFSQHLSKELRQLIKSIGQTKSKQEQDRIIQIELTNLKQKLNQKNITPKKIKQHLIRTLYIEMLGHSAQFAYIHAINLTQSKNIILKRIGYLMCTLFFNQDSQLLIMLVSTVLKDLSSDNIHEIIICLTSIGNCMNSIMAIAIQDAVIKLLSHTTDLVRKKAILILQKIKNLLDVQIPQFKQKIKKSLCDRQPSVMASTLNLYLQEAKLYPKKYRELTGSFVIILKQVIQHKLPKEFDYHRMPAPWIQIKLMKILQLLAKGDLKASQHCYKVLQQGLKRAEQTNNSISFAVTYQCVRTIANIYPNNNLIQQAANTLSRFLDTKSSNSMKYMGIQTLSMLYKQHPKLIEEHQLTIVDCLQSKDQTLQRETLDLLYKMTTNDNIEVIVSKMLNSLHSSTDDYFRNELVLKITELAQRFSPTHLWYLDTMQILFQLGNQYLKENVLNNFLKLVVENYGENQEFGITIIDNMKQLLSRVVPTDFILKVVCWILGEIGVRTYSNDPQKLKELAQIILKCLQCDLQHLNSRVWLIDALVKLSSASAFDFHDSVKNILRKYTANQNIQIYQRSLQSKMLAKYNSALTRSSEIDFEQGLPFLEEYVKKAELNGANKYEEIKSDKPTENELRFAPYEQTKKVHQNFPFPTVLTTVAEPTKIIQVSDIPIKPKQQKKSIYQERSLKSPTFAIEREQKPKKKFITPEEKAKKNLAQSLFGVKGPTGLKTTQISSKASQQRKQSRIVENNDLI